MEQNIVSVLLVFIVAFIVFLILREVMCWYWKINQMLSVLQNIDNKLSNLTLNSLKDANESTQETSRSPKNIVKDLDIENIIDSKNYIIQCPYCDNKETVNRNEYKYPSVYKKFNAELGGIMYFMKYTCLKCGKKFNL